MSSTYFSYNPLLRGAAWALVAWLGIEMLKPAFAFTEVDGAYEPRPFGKQNSYETEDGEIVSGTFFTYWMIPALFFVIFGLFV